jgi:hypothetical protein
VRYQKKSDGVGDVQVENEEVAVDSIYSGYTSLLQLRLSLTNVTESGCGVCYATLIHSFIHSLCVLLIHTRLNNVWDIELVTI